MVLTEKEIKRFKDILLRTLAKFIKICEENDLQYFCAGGTVIGAIRHKGYIPWDDDIDVFMPRSDYEKFKIIGNRYEGYKTISASNSIWLATFGKFYDTNTTLWELGQIPFVYGIYIDIFPLDVTDDDVEGFMQKYTKLRNLQRKYQMAQYRPSMSDFIFAITTRNKVQIIKNCSSLFVPRFLAQKFRKQMVEYEKRLASATEGGHYASYYGDYWQKEYLKREWFEGYIEVPFENLKVRICKGYHEYLSQAYGNYMNLPPVEKRVSHHYHYFLNMDRGMTIDEVKSVMKR